MANAVTCFCLSFRTGIILTFLWGIFWMWCWYHTCSFVWTGQYEEFFNNDDLPFTKNAFVVVPCAILSVLQPILFGLWLSPWPIGDVEWTRIRLVVGSAILLIIAIVFTFGGVYVMAIDVVAMGYVMKQTWSYYLDKKYQQEMKSKRIHSLWSNENPNNKIHGYLGDEQWAGFSTIWILRWKCTNLNNNQRCAHFGIALQRIYLFNE